MAHCINWTRPTVNLKCLVNNCFYVTLTSKNIIFSPRMLHAVRPLTADVSRWWNPLSLWMGLCLLSLSISVLTYHLPLFSTLAPAPTAEFRWTERVLHFYILYNAPLAKWPLKRISKAEGSAREKLNKLDTLGIRCDHEDTSEGFYRRVRTLTGLSSTRWVIRTWSVW